MTHPSAPGLVCMLVNLMAGCKLLSFLGCYSGYHQISLKEDDQIKTYFITPFGAYCYTTMSFGQKTPELCIDELFSNVSMTKYAMTWSKPMSMMFL
jgi:hypothetical protein